MNTRQMTQVTQVTQKCNPLCLTTKKKKKRTPISTVWLKPIATTETTSERHQSSWIVFGEHQVMKSLIESCVGVRVRFREKLLVVREAPVACGSTSRGMKSTYRVRSSTPATPALS